MNAALNFLLKQILHYFNYIKKILSEIDIGLVWESKIQISIKVKLLLYDTSHIYLNTFIFNFKNHIIKGICLFLFSFIKKKLKGLSRQPQKSVMGLFLTKILPNHLKS